MVDEGEGQPRRDRETMGWLATSAVPAKKRRHIEGALPVREGLMHGAQSIKPRPHPARSSPHSLPAPQVSATAASWSCRRSCTAHRTMFSCGRQVWLTRRTSTCAGESWTRLLRATPAWRSARSATGCSSRAHQVGGKGCGLRPLVILRRYNDSPPPPPQIMRDACQGSEQATGAKVGCRHCMARTCTPAACT